MKVIPYTPITDAMLISSNVAETDYPAWDAVTVFPLGARVISTATHRVYESIQAGNQGHDPVADVALPTPLWWKLVGATGRWAMFDGLCGQQTAHADSIVVELAPGRITDLALINVDAATVEASLVVGTETVWSATADLQVQNVFNWWDYFFKPIVRRHYVSFESIPSYTDGHLVVTISSTGGTARCGELVVGMSSVIGELMWAPRLEVIDYSRKDVDENGYPIIVERRFSKRLSCDLHLPTAQADETFRLLGEFRAHPCVWIGSKQFDGTIVFGFYRRGGVVISGRVASKCNIEIEGLI